MPNNSVALNPAYTPTSDQQAHSAGDTLEYELAFKEAVDQIYSLLVDKASPGFSMQSLGCFDAYQDCIYLKNRDGVVVFSNVAHRRLFSPQKTPIGRTGDQFLEWAMGDLTRRTDELVLGAAESVDCNHTGRGSDGRLFKLKTHKRNLAPLDAPGLAILGVTRPLSVLGQEGADPRHNLAERADLFSKLSESDREIARLVCLGVTGREIAEQTGLTVRSVEVHKKKILEALGLEQTVELIKLLVRLEDSGYTALGL